MPFFVVTALGVAVYALTKQVAGLYLEDNLHLAPREAMAAAGRIIALSSILMVLTQGWVLRILKLSKERLVLLGAALALGAGLTLLSQPGILGFTIALALLGPAFGFVLPSNLAALSVSAGEKFQGKAAGLNALAQWLGMSAGPFLGGSLIGLSTNAPFVFVVFSALIIALLSLLSFKEGKEG